MCRTYLVYEDSFDLLFIASNSNDRVVVIVRMDSRCIFLRKGDHGFQILGFTFTFDIGEVFYIHDLASIPSMGGASPHSLVESSYYSVECVAYKFVVFVLGCHFFFVGSWTSYVISPLKVRLVRPMGTVTLHVFLEVSLLDQSPNFFLVLVKIFSVMSIDSM